MYICIYIYIYVYVCVYIYIYRERERDVYIRGEDDNHGDSFKDEARDETMFFGAIDGNSWCDDINGKGEDETGNGNDTDKLNVNNKEEVQLNKRQTNKRQRHWLADEARPRLESVQGGAKWMMIIVILTILILYIY